MGITYTLDFSYTMVRDSRGTLKKVYMAVSLVVGLSGALVWDALMGDSEGRPKRINFL